MSKWKCTKCTDKDDPCILEVDDSTTVPVSCPYDFSGSQKTNWKIVKQKTDKAPKKKLTIEGMGIRGLILSDGKKYKKTSKCASCVDCCFRPKRDAEGKVYKDKCGELGLGYSKCGDYAWKRDKE